MPAQTQTRTIKKQNTKLIDSLMSAAAVVHPLMAIPQVYAIYTTQDVSGVSLWTWLGFMVLGLVFLIYSVTYKLKPLILNQVLWFVVDFLVVIGILLFR